MTLPRFNDYVMQRDQNIINEAVSVSNIQPIATLVVKYLKKYIGNVYFLPTPEWFTTSGEARHVGIRFFFKTKSFRLNWALTINNSAELLSIDLWDGSRTPQPFPSDRLIFDSQQSLVKVMPLLKDFLLNKLSTREGMFVSEEATLHEATYTSEQVQKTISNMIHALEMGVQIRQQTLAGGNRKYGPRWNEAQNAVRTIYSDLFKKREGSKQLIISKEDVAKIDKKKILDAITDDSIKYHVEPGTKESVEGVTDQDLERMTYEEQLDALKTGMKLLMSNATNAIFLGGRGGVGKFLENSAVIYTKQGATLTHGTVKRGDIILTPSGRESTVLQTFAFNNVPLFRVTLTDGSSTLAGGPHLWKVWDKTSHWDPVEKKRKHGGQWKTQTTEQLMQKGLQKRAKTISKPGKEIPAEWRFLIPHLPVPVNFDKQNLPVDPYVLGYLLGDGCISQPQMIQVTVGLQDQEFALTKLQNILGEGCLKTSGNSGIDFYLTNVSQLNKGLKDLNLKGTKSKTKFIPKQYLSSCFADRLNLLQGLMDTDGCVEGTQGNRFVYYSTSFQLATDVKNLALSFGKQASLTSRNHSFTGKAWRSTADDGRVCKLYRVNFSMPTGVVPISNPRKIAMCSKGNTREDIRGKGIVSIEYEKHGDATCIMIDDPEHLYITDDFMTTHNTETVERMLADAGKSDGEGYVKITGSASAPGIYRLLFQHKRDILLFDDSDSALTDMTSRNLFKAASDTKKVRKIAWMKGGMNYVDPVDYHGDEDGGDDGEHDYGDTLPRYFDFTGKIIFISNLPLEKLDPDGALRTRGYVISIDPTNEEMYDFMIKIANYIKLDVDYTLSLAQRIEVVEILKTRKVASKTVNLRSLVRGLNTRAGVESQGGTEVEWKKFVKTFA